MAGYDIGPRISLKGASEFNKEINSINDNLKEYKSELKSVDAEIQANGESTELLARKQELLEKLLETQTRKLNEYKREFNDLTQKQAEQKKKVDELTLSRDKAKNTLEELKKNENATTQEIEKASKELASHEKELSKANSEYNKTTSNVSKLKTGMNETKVYVNQLTSQVHENVEQLKRYTSVANQLAKVGDTLQTSGAKITKAGQSLSKYSAGVVAVGTVAMRAWGEVDDAMDTIAKGTGKVGEELEDLQQIAKNVYTTLPVDIRETGSAVSEINTRLNLNGKELENATKKFLKFSEINNMDVLSSVQLVSRAMGDAGIDTKDYSHVLDALTSAAQSSGISIDQLTTNITKYGAPMRALGYSIEESIALFSQWEKAGVNTEIAFSGMKKAISNFAKEGKDARVEFKKTLDEIANCPDIATATTKAIEVFGAKAGPDLADAIQTGKFSIEELNDVLENSGGQVEKTFDAILDPIDKSKVAFNSLKEAGAILGDTIQVALIPIMEHATNMIKNVTSWMNSLDDDTKTLIVQIGLVVAALGPALIILGTIVSSVGKLLSLAPAISSFFSMIMANPVLLVITGIAAALIYLYSVCEDFRNSVKKIIGEIGQYFGDLWNKYLKPIFSAFQGVIQKVNESLNNFYSEHKESIETIMELIGTVVQFLSDTIFTFIKDTITQITDFMNIVIPIITALLGIVVDVISAIIHFVFETIPEFFKNIKKWVTDLKDNIGKKVTSIKDKVSEIIEKIKKIIKKEIPKAISDIVKWVAELPSKVWKELCKVVDKVSSWGKNLYSAAKKGVKKTIDAIKEEFTSLPGKALTWGKDMIDGFISGIQRKAKELIDNVKGLAQGIKEFIGFSVPEKGPLSRADTFMPDFIDLMVNGIQQNKNKLINEVQSLAGMMSLDGEFTSTQSFTSDNSLKIEVPVYLNRKKVAEAVSTEFGSNVRSNRVAQGA